jgi:hypothetical protein
MVKGRPEAERLEMRRANQRNFRRNNPDGQLRLELLKYGVTVAWYRLKELVQGKVCAICGQHETAVRNGRAMRLAVDHNHTTNEARGLLCRACNRRLATLEDSEWRAKAEAYLAAHDSVKIADSQPV